MSAETIDRIAAELSTVNKTMKCLFLDFDGTIAELVSRPADASLSDSMNCCIEMLAETSHMHVCIVSGRNMDFLREQVTHSKISLCAEHGLKIALAQTGHIFEHHECKALTEKYKELEQQLASDLAVYTGAFIENKGSSLTVHVRDLQSASESEQVIELCSQRIKAIGFSPRRAHLALEAVASTKWNKGSACEYILIKKFGLHWSEHVDVLYAGDDLTDEDAFEALAGKAVTCRVVHDRSNQETKAKYQLHSVSEIELLLSAILKESTQDSITSLQ